MGYFLVLSIKDDPVKCVKVCGKSVVILPHFWQIHTYSSFQKKKKLFLYRLQLSPKCRLGTYLIAKQLTWASCIRCVFVKRSTYLPKVRSLLKIGFFKVHCCKKSDNLFYGRHFEEIVICVEKKSVLLAEILLFF